MNYEVNISYSSNISKFQKFTSVLAFAIIIFISFFGTAAPFPERYTSVDDISTSNIFNQVIYLFVLFLIIISVYNHKRFFVQTLIKEKFFFLLILWYFLGMLWSVDPFSTFKMALRLFTIYLAILVFFINYPYYQAGDKIVKIILTIFILTSLVVVVTIPGATDPDFNTWRGFSPSKNIFGQVCVLAFVLGFDLYLREESLAKKLLVAFLSFLALIMLFGSQSSTSIIGVLVFVSIISIRIIDHFFRPLGLGRFMSSALLLGFMFSVFLILIVFPVVIEYFTGLFGKDPSFTGRTDLWLIALNSFIEQFPLGTAYGAFWNPANKALASIHLIFPWLPMQAHSGILDTLNEGGIIGFSLFISATFISLRNNWNFKNKNIGFYIVLIILLLNTQETTLLVPGYLATTLYFYYYLRSILAHQ